MTDRKRAGKVKIPRMISDISKTLATGWPPEIVFKAGIIRTIAGSTDEIDKVEFGKLKTCIAYPIEHGKRIIHARVHHRKCYNVAVFDM